MSIGDKIKKARIDNKLTQKELATLLRENHINVGNTTISNWEKNISKPDVDFLGTLCKILNISSDELLDIDNKIGEFELNNDHDEQFKKILKDKGLMDENDCIDEKHIDKLLKLADMLAEIEKKED